MLNSKSFQPPFIGEMQDIRKQWFIPPETNKRSYYIGHVSEQLLPRLHIIDPLALYLRRQLYLHTKGQTSPFPI